MILHLGVRTTEPTMVASKTLASEEDESSAITEFLETLIVKGGFQRDRYDHSIVVYYEPSNTPNRKRELLIPVEHPIDDVETRILPSLKVAFLVFKGTDTDLEEYYKKLQEYIKQTGLKASNDVYSIEIMYVPEDLDEQDYTLEIMVPLEN